MTKQNKGQLALALMQELNKIQSTDYYTYTYGRPSDAQQYKKNRKNMGYKLIGDVITYFQWEINIHSTNNQKDKYKLITEILTPVQEITDDNDVKIEVLNSILNVNWYTSKSKKYFESLATLLLTTKHEYILANDYLLISKFEFANSIFIIANTDKQKWYWLAGYKPEKSLHENAGLLYDTAFKQYEGRYIDTRLVTFKMIEGHEDNFISFSSDIYKVNKDEFIIKNARNFGYDPPHISINFIRSTNDIVLGDKIDTFSKFFKDMTLADAKKYENCLLNVLARETQHNTKKPEILEALYAKYKPLTNNYLIGIKGEYILSIARRLCVQINLYSQYGYQTGTPYLELNKQDNSNNKIVKVLTNNGHAMQYKIHSQLCGIKYFDTMTQQEIEALKLDENTLLNQNGIDTKTIQESEFLINDTTLYKQFRPSNYIQNVENIDQNKKYMHAHDLKSLQFIHFVQSNKIKKTNQYAHIYKAATIAINQYKLDITKYSNYIQIDHNSSYLSAKNCKYYKGFPNNSARWQTCTNDFYTQNNKNISVVFVQIKSITKHENIIETLLLKTRRNLYMTVPTFETIKNFIEYEITHALFTTFNKSFMLSEFAEQNKNLFISKYHILSILGRLSYGGISIDENLLPMQKKNKILYNVSKLDRNIIINELARDNIKFVDSIVTDNNYTIEYADNQIKQYNHITAFIYSYSVSQILEMMFKLNDNNIKFVAGIVDSIYIPIAPTQSNAEKQIEKDILSCFEPNHTPEILLDSTQTKKQIENIIHDDLSAAPGKFKIQPVSISQVHKIQKNNIAAIKKESKHPQKSELLQNIDPAARIIIINVPAGIGKNYSVYNHIPENSLFLAPSNSRKMQIREELEQINLKYLKNINVMTIHKFLKIKILKSDHHELSGIEKYEKNTLQAQTPYYSHLIIDEFSLSNQILISECIKRAEHKYIYIIGDDHQCSISDSELKPVNLEFLKTFENSHIVTKYTRHDKQRHDIQFGQWLDNHRENTFQQQPQQKPAIKKDLRKPQTLEINNTKIISTVPKQTNIIDDFEKDYKPQIIDIDYIKNIQNKNDYIIISSRHKLNSELNKQYLEHQTATRAPIYYRNEKGYKYIPYEKYHNKELNIKQEFNDNIKKFIAWASTIHTLQGVTIPANIKLILDVQTLQGNHQAAYTAITRIKNPNDIILLK